MNLAENDPLGVSIVDSPPNGPFSPNEPNEGLLFPPNEPNERLLFPPNEPNEPNEGLLFPPNEPKEIIS